MQRYFVDQEQGFIEGKDAFHIIQVMRMKINDEMIVCAQQICHKVKITKIDHKVYYETIERLIEPKHFQLTLIQGLPKNPKLEFISKYATMFGVSHFIFVPMKRSESKITHVENKMGRYQTIMKEASELSHRFYIPTSQLVKKVETIDFKQFDCVIVLDEEEQHQTIDDLDHLLNLESHIAIVVGPEGGIDDKERNYYQSIGAHFITLGKYIFSTESASLPVLSHFILKSAK